MTDYRRLPALRPRIPAGLLFNFLYYCTTVKYIIPFPMLKCLISPKNQPFFLFYLSVIVFSNAIRLSPDNNSPAGKNLAAKNPLMRLALTNHLQTPQSAQTQSYESSILPLWNYP